MSQLCNRVNMSRQNYYKTRRRRQCFDIDEGVVLEAVKAERRQQPRLATRKLHKMLQSRLESEGVHIGRDRLFEVLRANDLLVEPLKRSARTTNSRHSLPVFINLIKDIHPSKPNEIWVSDITYIRTDEDFVYLALIMDRFSRKVVGYYCGDTLETSGTIRALKHALGSLQKGDNPIHHSDRGSQYCCHEYVRQLQAKGIQISMTEEMHCYENAHAERLNGILKQEYALGCTFSSKSQAYKAVDQAVMLYNTKRPHRSLGYRVPNEVHKQAA